MTNINDTFFDGQYKDIWKILIPDELTNKEVEFMLPYFGLKPGSKVLDLMCGYGRHALALARKGMKVTAVDNLEEYIAEIKAVANEEHLPLQALQADIMGYKPDDEFDLVICMGNSLNFFNAGDVQDILSEVSLHLNPGGHLLINSWSIAEIAIKNFSSKSWSFIGGKKFLTDSRFFIQPARIETESTIIDSDGNQEIKTGVDYLYSINELEKMFNTAGLTLKDIYSIPGKKKFTLGEPRAYLIAQKN